MEIHQLKYFVAVAETGSFSRAAERCHVAQPSLSQQIKKLEDTLGQRLFDRLGRRIALTDAGTLLLDRAQSILGAVEDARRELRDTGEHQGTLALGAIPTIAPYLLPAAIRRLRRQHPALELTIEENLTEHLLASTVAGDLDLALVAQPIDDARLHVEPLLTEALVLAVPRDHRLAARSKIKLADLRDEPFVMLSEMHCLGRQVSSFCLQHEFQPKVSCSSAQLSTVLAFVAAGLGIALVPEMAAACDRSSQRLYRELSGTRPARSVAAVWHRSRYRKSLAAQLLAELRRALEDARAKP